MYEKELCFLPFCPGILCFTVIATITIIFRLYIPLQYIQGNISKQVTHMYMKNIIILINTVVNMAVRNGHRGKINKIKKFIPIVIQTKKQSSGIGKDRDYH